MSTRDIKEKINNVLDSIPDEILEDVLKYLKALTDKTKEKISLSQNIRKILEEDRSLLERLAK